jgi:hypothetical protein
MTESARQSKGDPEVREHLLDLNLRSRRAWGMQPLTTSYQPLISRALLRGEMRDKKRR